MNSQSVPKRQAGRLEGAASPRNQTSRLVSMGCANLTAYPVTLNPEIQPNLRGFFAQVLRKFSRGHPLQCPRCCAARLVRIEVCEVGYGVFP